MSAKTPTVPVTLHLTPRQVERLDAYVATRNARVVGRPVTRESEARRIVFEEIGLADRMEPSFWAGIGKGGNPKVDPS